MYESYLHSDKAIKFYEYKNDIGKYFYKNFNIDVSLVVRKYNNDAIECAGNLCYDYNYLNKNISIIIRLDYYTLFFYFMNEKYSSVDELYFPIKRILQSFF